MSLLLKHKDRKRQVNGKYLERKPINPSKKFIREVNQKCSEVAFLASIQFNLLEQTFLE